MRKFVFLTSLLSALLLFSLVSIILFSKVENKKLAIESTKEQTEIEQNQVSLMTITSSAFAHNRNIPARYTCDGGNVSPSLSFSDVPTEAKSLVLIVDDPDAPSKTWVHWTVFNINPGTITFPDGLVPAGSIEGMTDFGKPGYGGPCPPSGTHHYYFKLYALDTSLILGRSAVKEDIEVAMKGHVLEKTELIGLYKRI